MSNDRKIKNAVGVGILFGFVVLAILAALFDVVNARYAAIFVSLGFLFAVALGLIGKNHSR